MEITASQQPLLQTLTMCNNTTALGNQSRNEMNPQCFLQSSPESRVSPQISPNRQVSNGPLNKPAFVLQSASLVNQPPKTREPPRYEEAVKQSRGLLMSNASQRRPPEQQVPVAGSTQMFKLTATPSTSSEVPTATSQHMDDLFDILVESGEIPPFLHQDPPGPLNRTHPVTASITTLPVNTALSRSPPQIQLAPPTALSAANSPGLAGLPPLVTDNQLEAFLERTLAETPPASDPRTRGLMEELQGHLVDQQSFIPMDTSDMSFHDSSPSPASLNLALFDPNLDNMEWLDLTAGPSSPPGFPTEFLEANDMQLHFD
ncbi:hypothetical protein AMECASPLE_033843 [Ameca splendens]|uniref:Uncharacterized protein n=1 Tax=Ameca splendens TaxID=208324 RepID=A0ABV0YV89_9TELE